ncbi:MAG: hypothetical protein ACFB10_15935 [Salibacteraceae bacterium]
MENLKKFNPEKIDTDQLNSVLGGGTTRTTYTTGSGKSGKDINQDGVTTNIGANTSSATDSPLSGPGKKRYP